MFNEKALHSVPVVGSRVQKYLFFASRRRAAGAGPEHLNVKFRQKTNRQNFISFPLMFFGMQGASLSLARI